jgi:hypothetical protein
VKILEKNKLLARLNELIIVGKGLSANSGISFEQWRYNCRNILGIIYPNKFNVRDQEYEKLFVGYLDSGYEQLLALLLSTKDDLEKGLIGNIELEIRIAENKSLLDYSFKLLDENDDALDRCACVLARIVLENALQILCEKRKLDSTKKASELNQQLWKNEAYSQAEWRRIDGLLDTGNAAAHSSDKWSKIGKNERTKMVRDVEEIAKKVF